MSKQRHSDSHFQHPPSTPAAHPESRVVLVAEDEEALREIAVAVLQRAGYLLLAADSAEAALKAVRQDGQKIDLLVSDVYLPGCGTSLFQELIAMNPQMKVIFVSGHPRDVVAAELPIPADAAFLEKPFDTTDLVALARKILH